MTPDTLFCDLLAARSGIVCAVGAGGKKSVLRAIAAEHPGRVAVTGTVPFVPPPDSLSADRITGDLDALAEQLDGDRHHRIVVFGRPAEKKGRWGGLPGEIIANWHPRFGFDVTLVKADGARMRWVKAPADDEPVLPPVYDTLIPVFSARALGEPLTDRIAHRPSLVEHVTGCRAGEIFQPEHAARLLASNDGLLRGAGQSQVRPVINMVDDPQRRELALEAARLALEMTTRFDQLLLVRLKHTTELVEIVNRGAKQPCTP